MVLKITQMRKNIVEFKYLDSILTADGGIEREVLTRIALASAAFQRLRPMLNSRQMPPPPSYGQSFYTQQRHGEQTKELKAR